jgi:hypothetical protein
LAGEETPSRPETGIIAEAFDRMRMSQEDSVETAENTTSIPIWWRIHDIVVGLLAGFGTGVVAGLFATRISDTNVVVAIGGALGAILGVFALVRSRRQPGGFVTAIVIIAWVLLVGSALFLTALVVAVANFE